MSWPFFGCEMIIAAPRVFHIGVGKGALSVQMEVSSFQAHLQIAVGGALAALPRTDMWLGSVMFGNVLTQLKMDASDQRWRPLGHV